MFVNAFQSSAGYLKSLTRTSFSKSKSTPIRGYLDSLGKLMTDAVADQDTAPGRAAEKLKPWRKDRQLTENWKK
jgi:hypothetical protein